MCRMDILDAVCELSLKYDVDICIRTERCFNNTLSVTIETRQFKPNRIRKKMYSYEDVHDLMDSDWLLRNLEDDIKELVKEVKNAKFWY